jgi:hypothetical protein
MSSVDFHPSTGLPGMDAVLKGVLPGDNIVWQVGSIDEYQAFVTPYVQTALHENRKLVYFRFASHPPLIEKDPRVETHHLDPEDGFETFIANIHAVIEKAGYRAYYVFDCLSELAVDWYSDQMLGNFFMLTCPYLFDLQTVTYFGLFRGTHSQFATGPIVNTTQLYLDVFKHAGRTYVRPIKVQHRFSHTMNLLHVWDGDDFRPVTESAVISEILTTNRWWSGLQSIAVPGSWEKTFVKAEEVCTKYGADALKDEENRDLFSRICRMIVSRDPGMLKLISENMSLEDVLEIKHRMIGSGLIGGKAVGMLLARCILRKKSQRMKEILEAHDSFYVGSDVFYTFLVRNGIWWDRQKQRNPRTFLEGADQARQKILTGNFPADIIMKFEQMLDYYGQSPIIVRSSSLLEDNFGNSFAGKYDSVFCANQGPKERRLENFIAAVRTIYASSMSKEALAYRERHGILDRDEQMALLVMRVSGSMYKRLYFPQIAGVGFSFNPYVWNETIDPEAGVMRLVFGLGTRAVNRSDDDYTRVVALNEPTRRPEASFQEIAQYSQRKMEYIDLEANQLVEGYFMDVAAESKNLPVRIFASEDSSVPSGSRQKIKPWILTFDTLLTATDFVRDMRDMLDILEKAYDYPVDIEFTANFLDNSHYKINLVQCRPLQVQGIEKVTLPSVTVQPENELIATRGAVVGQSRFVQLDRMIFVVPEKYGHLPMPERYEVARTIGEINRAHGENGGTLMIVGPGRWGTSTPALGIPVSFSDISNTNILCEVVAMRDDLIPDVSLGTHFLNELVEMNMLYIAMFPEKPGNSINRQFLDSQPNRLIDFAPGAARWADTIRVIDLSPGSLGGTTHVHVLADTIGQKLSCFLDK